MLSKDEIYSNSKFYRWTDIQNSIKTETPVEMDGDEFFEDIRKDPPYNNSNCFVINNTVNGKTANDFLCPSWVFIDLDFHFDKPEEKNKELMKFYTDTKTKSLQEFVDKISKDPYCVSGGLSKSKVGIRLFFNVQTKFYQESILYDLDYPTDWNKQIHKSNWEFVLNYLHDKYGIDLNSLYASQDKSAGKLSQVTFRYCRTGSFYNENWLSMFNENCIVKTENRYETDGILERYETCWLAELYHQNEDKFRKIFEHYDGFKSLFYSLRNQSDDEIYWHYHMIDECYSSTGGFRTQGHLDSPDKFYSHVKDQTTGVDLPLRAFYFKRGIIFNDPLILIDEIPEDVFENLKKELLPNIPDSVYKNLPDTLKLLTSRYSGPKKDVLLGAILSHTGIYFHNVKTTYWEGAKMYPNLYNFTVGDTGVGKSVIKKAKILTYDMEKYYREKFSEQKKAYDEQPREKGMVEEKIKKPKMVKYVIGGDAGRAGVIRQLISNEEVLSVFESEAEILVQNNDAKWGGDWTDIMRNGFGNETIDKTRKDEENSFYIDCPRLHITTSGTFNQVPKVVGKEGVTNGTFARFMWYWWWDENPQIENPHSNTNNDEYYETSKNLFDWYLSRIQNNEINFDFTDEQKEMFWQMLVDLQRKVITIHGNIGDSIIKRCFMMIKKISIILTMYREFDKWMTNTVFNLPIPQRLYSTDLDFNTAVEIVNVFMKHGLTIINQLQPEDFKYVEPTKRWTEKFLRLLPDTFTREDAQRINKDNFGKSSHTVNRVLRTMCLNNVLKIGSQDKNSFFRI